MNSVKKCRCRFSCSVQPHKLEDWHIESGPVFTATQRGNQMFKCVGSRQSEYLLPERRSELARMIGRGTLKILNTYVTELLKKIIYYLFV